MIITIPFVRYFRNTAVQTICGTGLQVSVVQALSWGQKNDDYFRQGSQTRQYRLIVSYLIGVHEEDRRRLSLPIGLLLWAFLCCSSRLQITTSKSTMSVNPRCYALSQISFLVASITKKNYKYNSAEITSVRSLSACVIFLINAQFVKGKSAPIVIGLSLSVFFLFQLVEKHGAEAEKYLFRCLLSQVDFCSIDGRNSSKDGQQLQLLAQEANAVTTRPNFVAVLCYGFENQENKVGSAYYVKTSRKSFPLCGLSVHLCTVCISSCKCLL